MQKIDKFLGKWASRKLLVLFLAIFISLVGDLNDNLTYIMITYVTVQGLADAKSIIENFKK